ncbi:MAG: tRNA pseudouridine(38-40) synthase TruA [Candidatus Nanopelagicales bacterium]
MTRLRLDLAYDGTDFAGWARQPGLRTVQGCVEDALAQVLRLPHVPSVTCAGRTDAGVHARGQVAHVDIDGEVDLAAVTRGLRGVLPGDVWVTDLSVAPEGFDARFSALSRHYRYRVCDEARAWDPLVRREVVRSPRPLDLDAMNAAAEPLLGEQDFAALCKPREGGSTIRTLESLEWARGLSGLAEMTVSADAFCHSLVRALVGVLMPVGDGRQAIAWPGQVVASRARDPRVTVMPAHGLVLERVSYPADSDLAARQEVTRATRTPRDS